MQVTRSDILKATRIALGAYLIYYFVRILPYAQELFGTKGVVPDESLFYEKVLPNIISSSSGIDPGSFILVLIVVAAMFTSGFFTRTNAFILWYGWMCLYTRNLFTEFPSLPYTGWLLLAFVLVTYKKEEWDIQGGTITAAWIVLGLSYSVSGWTKWASDLWTTGGILPVLLDSGLATQLGSAISSWWILVPLGVLFMVVQTAAAPLFCVRTTRKWAWMVLVAGHLFALFTLDLAQVSFGMLIVHLFVMDPDWFKKKG